jgi:hypothetical protein
MLHQISEAIEAHKDEFFSDAYRHMDLPYDGLRMVKLYPAVFPKAVAHHVHYERTGHAMIWRDYLVNRVRHLCSVIDRLAVVSDHLEGFKHVPEFYVPRSADVFMELRKYLYCFVLGHAPLTATAKVKVMQ